MIFVRLLKLASQLLKTLDEKWRSGGLFQSRPRRYSPGKHNQIFKIKKKDEKKRKEKNLVLK